MARQLRNGKATATHSGDEEVKREDDVELVEGGGFIIEKKKRNSRARKQTLKNEEQGEEVSQPATRTRRRSRAVIGNENDDHIVAAEESPQGTSSARSAKRSSREAVTKPKRQRMANGRSKAKVKVLDDEDGNEGSDTDSGDEDYVPDEASSNDEADEAAAAEPEPELSEEEEEPPAPRRRAPRKKSTAPKKPRKKIDYFKWMTEKLFANHEELKTVFDDLNTMKPISVEEAPQPIGMTINLLPFQLEGLNWLIKQEESAFQGGVLADEMGMGKTIQTIALFMSDRNKTPNLVVAPAVAIMQWKSEIEAHTNGLMKAYIFHGASRTNNMEELLKYDVILTTYSVLESVWRKQQYGFKRVTGVHKEKSALHAIDFYRVILDEAHSIKDRQSGTAKSVNNLKCVKKWCLSGTPLQNRIGELYSLIRFLRIQPFCEYFCTKCECRSMEWNFINNSLCAQCGCRPMQHTNFFNHFFLKNIIKYGITDAEGNVKEEEIAERLESNVEDAVKVVSNNESARGAEAFTRLQLLLARIMLRRTKMERADDLGLPPKLVEVRYDLFNPEEKDLYQSLYSDVNRQFNDYVEEGVVLNNYANIFTLITRMRQLADHPDLVLKRLSNRKVAGYEAIVCELCDDEAEDAIESKCHHKFCRLCIKEYIESFDSYDSKNKLECPVCHIGLSIDLNAPALEVAEELEARGNKKTSIVNKINMSAGRWKSSTKIEALVEELYKLRSNNHTIKSIVYSQFTSFLDLVDWRLKRAGFKTVRLQGSMSPQQRANTISHFMNNVNVEVFLVSLKAGGVALNLTEASQIFIMDPWWNPAVEWQCDRVHRILQMRPVRIVKFCIADSIEKKILELQEKKADMVNATVGGDETAANRLTPADLQFLFST